MEPKKRQAISLLRLLAQGSTDKVRELLSRYGAKSSGSYDELAASLADVYKRVPDKVTFEKEIVAMHPHKDFILRYNNTPVKQESKEAIENLQVMTKPETIEVKETEVKEKKENCSGCGGGCGGKMSNAEGNSTSEILGHILRGQQNESRNRTLISTGIFIAGVIGVIYFIKHHKV